MFGINTINFIKPLNPVSSAPSFCGKRFRLKLGDPEPKEDIFERSNTGVKNDKIIDDPTDYNQKFAIANRLHKEAEKPWQRFVFILEDVFGEDLASTKNPAGSRRAIRRIKTKIKSVNSIHEKMASKKITSQKAALEEMDDILQARIILNHGKKSDGRAIAKNLINAINDGKIEIVEIDHYRPNALQERDLLEYITSAKIREIEEALEKKGKAIKSKHEEKTCGYLAEHIIVSIPKTKYKAEIQIMGENVEEFKEIEDFCYKMKCGKKVKNAPKKLKCAFNKLINDENLMNQFNLYTRAAYRLQRLRDASSDMVKDIEGEFLRLENFEGGKDLPAILDFNEVAKLIREMKEKNAAEIGPEKEPFSLVITSETLKESYG